MKWDCSMRMASVLAMALAFGAVQALAQSVEADPPVTQERTYILLREDEDWSFLRDSSLRRDFWDSIKYIPIRNNGDWFMTMGGEAREMWEQIGNDNWGQAPYMNGYLNERYMLYFDIHYGKHVRTFVELKRGLNSFRVGGPRPFDAKKLDFQAALLERDQPTRDTPVKLLVLPHAQPHASHPLIHA